MPECAGIKKKNLPDDDPPASPLFRKNPSGVYHFNAPYGNEFLVISPSDLEKFRKAPLAESIGVGGIPEWEKLFIVTKIDFEPVSGKGRIYGFKDYLVSPDRKAAATFHADVHNRPCASDDGRRYGTMTQVPVQYTSPTVHPDSETDMSHLH